MQLRASLADRPPYRKFLIIVGLTLIGAVLFTALGTILAKILYGIDLSGDPALLNSEGNPSLAAAFRLFQALAAVGTFVLPAFAAAYLFSEHEKTYLGLKVRPGAGALITVLLMLVAGIPFINWMMQLNSGMHLPAGLKSLEDWMLATEEQAGKITRLILGGDGFGDLLINLLVIAVIPAIGEELLFRGVIQKQFSELAQSRGAAVVLTAFLFSALHMQFFGFLPRFVLGIFLGYLYLWSGSLWLPIAAHFINNAGAVLLSWLASRRLIALNPDTIGTEAGQEKMLAASVFLTWMGLWLLRRQFKKT